MTTKKRKTAIDEIHSCGYFCDKPACIKAQRDELVKTVEQMSKEIERFNETIGELETMIDLLLSRSKPPLWKRWLSYFQ